MRDVPIIFSAPMIRALLVEARNPGRGKRMTRRLALGKPSLRKGSLQIVRTPWTKIEKGDRLWVRETVQAVQRPDGRQCVRFVADNAWLDIPAHAADGWKILHAYRKGEGEIVPPIHMPRWASRLTLRVIGTKTEPLHHITIRDVMSEGIEDIENILAFPQLWDDLHGPGAWAKNPEVVAISFEVIEQNIRLIDRPAEAAE